MESALEKAEGGRWLAPWHSRAQDAGLSHWLQCRENQTAFLRASREPDAPEGKLRPGVAGLGTQASGTGLARDSQARDRPLGPGRRGAGRLHPPKGMWCLLWAAAAVTAKKGEAGAGRGCLPSCVQVHVPQGSACQSDEVCGGPGGDWEEGSPKGPAPGRDGTWNQPRAARLPIRACHLCPRAGGQPTLEGHGAITTDGHGGAARSLEPAAIECREPSPSPARPRPDHMPSVS